MWRNHPHAGLADGTTAQRNILVTGRRTAGSPGSERRNRVALLGEKGTAVKRLFVTGGSGFIGGHVARLARGEWDVTAAYGTHLPNMEGVSWKRVDLADASAVKQAVDDAKPDAILHLGAVSNIDLCEREQDYAQAVNVGGTIAVTEAALEHECRLVSVSTDNVFDGERGSYNEDDAPNPINFYGKTKVLAEEAVHRQTTHALVVRIPLTLGFPVTGAGSFLAGISQSVQNGDPIWFATREVRSPIDVTTLARALLELSGSEIDGVIHVAGTEAADRGALGRAVLEKLGVPADNASYEETRPGRENRPADISLDVTRASFMLTTDLPDFATAVDRSFERAATGTVGD